MIKTTNLSMLLFVKVATYTFAVTVPEAEQLLFSAHTANVTDLPPVPYIFSLYAFTAKLIIPT